jgi:hypothetical protein
MYATIAATILAIIVGITANNAIQALTAATTAALQ